MPERISIRNLRKTFKRNGRVALNDLSLYAEAGEVTAVVGPNGAGKTTLFQTIAGLLTFESGQIIYPKGCAPEDVFLVSENANGFMPALSVLENYRYLLSLHCPTSKLPTREDAIAQLTAFNLEKNVDEPVQHISMGMRQRLTLAIARNSGAKILLLDEPTNGLDILEARSFALQVKDLADSQDQIIIMSSHQPSAILSLATNINFIKDGRIVERLKDTGQLIHEIDLINAYLAANGAQDARVL